MLKPLFIDTGGIDILVDPNEPSLLRFWQRFPKGSLHCTSHIVYWEFLRRFDPLANSEIRQRFVKLVKRNGIGFSVFGERERHVAVRIYHGVKSQLENIDKATAKESLMAMHNDIMIASEAVVQGRTVLTQDVGDWGRIRDVVEKQKIGKLVLIDKKDIQNES